MAHTLRRTVLHSKLKIMWNEDTCLYFSVIFTGNVDNLGIPLTVATRLQRFIGTNRGGTYVTRNSQRYVRITCIHKACETVKFKIGIHHKIIQLFFTSSSLNTFAVQIRQA